MTARSFEDLVAWQRARALTKQIYDVTNTDPFSRDFRLVGQMRASAVSVMSNISEGFERFSPAEFHQGLVHAKGSAGELRSQLYVALDANYIEESRFAELKSQCSEVSRLLERLRAEVDKQRHKS